MKKSFIAGLVVAFFAASYLVFAQGIGGGGPGVTGGLTPVMPFTVYPNSVCLDATNQDTCLVRDAANTLALKNGTNIQAFRIHGSSTVYASITTDSVGSVIFGTTGTNYWQIDSNHNFLPVNAAVVAVGSSANPIAGLWLTGSLNLGTTMAFSSTAPTISSGFGTSPSIVSGGTATSFRVNVGTGGTATSGVVGMPAASNGWNCFVTDQTTANVNTRQSASTTTSVTFGTTAAWTASDILIATCAAF